MGKRYFEVRKKPSNGNGLSTAVMRHLHTRQHLGKAVIVCQEPTHTLNASRKQWLKLARHIQRQRASTLNADKILKYTHTVTHMQHMQFTADAKHADTDSDVLFVSPHHLGTLPANRITCYVLTPLDAAQTEQLINKLAVNGLVVDYTQAIDWPSYNLSPKSKLENKVREQWLDVAKFLDVHGIEVRQLLSSHSQNIEAFDEALDKLLEESTPFLRVVNEFNESLQLARPLKTSKQLRTYYDAVSLLAYRVQMLTPGSRSQKFLEAYNEDDAFFLYDASRVTSNPRAIAPHLDLQQTIDRHMEAGRLRLATALNSRYKQLRSA